MSDAADLDTLLAALYEARDRGEVVDLEQLAREHPEHADALRAHARAEHWIEELSSALGDPLVSEPGAIDPPEVEGHTILGEIARGGMGVVFEAEQHAPKRRVAIKMLRDAALATPEDVRRFEREAQAAAELDHPGIVRILAVGVTDGRAWYSMPLAAGGNLAEHMDEIVGDPRAAARIARDVARAVAHGHSHGVLHRDLKPSNVLLDEHGGVLVADFGLARREEPGGSANTRTGTLLGTPTYMAPEQARGDVRSLDERADIWSLGVLLYQLLAGRPPFVGAGAAAVLHQVLHDDVPRLRTVARGAPEPLERICHACLARDPADRYASMRDVADDLDRWLAGRPVSARKSALAGRVGHWLRRRPVLLVGGLLGALAVGLLALAWSSARERDTEVRRRQARELLGTAERLAAEDDHLGAAVHFAAAHRLEPSWLAGVGLRAHLAPVPRHVLPTGPQPLWRVRFDPTGGLVAAGSGAGRVHLWSLGSGAADPAAGGVVLEHMPGTPVRGLAFDPTGARLATGDEDGTLRVFDTRTHAEVASVRTAAEGARPAVLALAWLDDARVIAGDEGGRLHVWTVGTDEARSHRVLETPASITALVPAVDGATCIVGFGTQRGTARLLRVDAGTGAILAEGPRHELSVWDAAHHADRGLLATCDERGAYLLDARTFARRHTLPHAAAVGALAFSADGRRLYTATVHGDVRTFDTATGREAAAALRHAAQVYGVAAEPRGVQVATVGLDGTLRLWTPPDGRPEGVRRAVGLATIPHAAGCGAAPDGSLLAWALAADAEAPLALRLHGSADAAAPAVASLPGAGRVEPAVGALEDGGWWVATASGERLTLHRLTRRGDTLALDRIAEAPLHGASTRLGMVPTERLVWAADAEALTVWRVTPAGLETLRTVPGSWHVWASPSAGWCARAARSGGHVLHVERLADGAGAATHPMDKAIARACVDAHGRRAAVALVDGRHVQVLDAATGRLACTIPQATAHGMAFVADGRGLLTHGATRHLRLWSTATGEPLGRVLDILPRLGSEDLRLRHLVLAPDGRAAYVTTQHAQVAELDLAWLAPPPAGFGWPQAYRQATCAAGRRVSAEGDVEVLDPEALRALCTRRAR